MLSEYIVPARHSLLYFSTSVANFKRYRSRCGSGLGRSTSQLRGKSFSNVSNTSGFLLSWSNESPPFKAPPPFNPTSQSLPNPRSATVSRLPFSSYFSEQKSHTEPLIAESQTASKATLTPSITFSRQIMENNI